MGLWRSVPLISLSIFIVGCGEAFTALSKKSGGSSSSSTGTESSYCSGTTAVSGSATVITATAKFDRYIDGSSGLVNTDLNNVIRFAEVLILNSSGTVIQCGETDSTGAVGATDDMGSGTHGSPGLSIPRVAGTYTLKVNSRAYNDFVKASVLNNPTSALPYSVSITFTIASTDATATPTLPNAPMNATLQGGAFNILDQIYRANNFLRNNTACPFCSTFTVAPKVTVYWTAGLSPGTYYGSPSTGISFFNPTNYSGFPSGLYILGGISGSTCVDTDHFDKSVILHEYGHFLEKAYATSDSPGGSHNGNGLIDPRLSWSEGWADYFQGQVLSRDFYRDTTGNAGCGNASLAFSDFSLTTQSADIPTQNGEGTFREFATARALTSATTSYTFPYIWSAFSDATYGLKNASFHFRNPGLFFKQFYYTIVTRASLAATDYDTAMSTEKQANNSQKYYAYPVSAKVASCHTTDANYTFPATTPVTSGNTRSQLLSNKYFQYTYDGTNDSIVYLVYTPTTSTYGSIPYDLDLYVYKEGYVFLDGSTLAGASDQNYPEAGGYEVVNLAGRPAGTYLINISVFTSGANRDDTQFYLQTNSGKYLCP
jgi:hypothetical protein